MKKGTQAEQKTWTSPEQLMEMVETALRESGIPYETEQDLDRLQSSIDAGFKEFQVKGKELADKRRGILKKCGMTDAQIDWDNYSNLDLGIKDALELKKINKKVAKLVDAHLEAITFQTYINERRA